ncbi:MAG: peptidoglycan DD-metalloendopeptidase family protein [Rhizobiales bacterium]|nr:peptidoglycan DD-metalloendopeptidase family protein [Hyphomicrobiales bacterium]
MRPGTAIAKKLRYFSAFALILLLAACNSYSRPWWDNPNYSSSRTTTYQRDTRSSGGTYVVRSGDTVYRIARMHNVPIRSLIDANRLSPPYAIVTGQRLVIPAGRFHVVERGETVYSISRRYGVDQSSLTSLNRIPAPYMINVGQKLQLPSTGSREIQVADSLSGSGSGSGSRRASDDDHVGVPLARPGTPVIERPTRVASVQKKPPLPPTPAPSGAFIWPARGKILSTFGSKGGGLNNDGINIAVAEGASVRAAQSGVVAYAGNELKGYGNLLLVRHANGWITAYAHNSKLLVKRGDTVTKGQTISYAGSTGSVTSPQVHFEVRKGSKAIDPQTVLGS